MTDDVLRVDEADQQIAEERQEDVIVDILSGEEKRPTDQEQLLQRMIQVMAGEYHFPLETMARNVPIKVEVDGRRRNRTADLVIYREGTPHTADNIERVIVVQPPTVKVADKSRGIDLLKDLLDGLVSCEFGLWTNGRDIAYIRKEAGPVLSSFTELSDFPGKGETLGDLDTPDRRIARVAVAEDLRETILRCHDYLYGNQAMRAERAFGEMIKLIFCKIQDERQLRASSAYRRQFWVGVTERNTPEGQRAIASRVQALFKQLKQDPDVGTVFRAADEIELEPRHLAWIAGELARYQLLDAEVDIKGMAYEAMMATTMKREKGQFFTPRNIVEAMVEILAPLPGERVLDPACGSGRFLVACLDRFRRLRAEAVGPAGESEMRRRRNSRAVMGEASAYARGCLFGVDADPELQRAAKMNMLINNDGHGNLFLANSLEVTQRALAERTFDGAEQLGFESFDVVLTNPPFGTKIPIDDPNVLRSYDLAHRWLKGTDGVWIKQEEGLRAKMPPEILFIERCWQWLKEGGRMGIVLPDGILGGPDNEFIRAWILQHAEVLASIDLPVEAFLPQVGVQASLLFLRKRLRREVSAGNYPRYPIFMGIVEAVGHDRRGNPVFRRDEDGRELFETYDMELTVRRHGHDILERRTLRRKRVADDLPGIVADYRRLQGSGLLQ
jgi:type I restriction enzyme M protein